MKKFGFGKKSDGDEDSSRGALFGNRSKKVADSGAANPYAQQEAPPNYSSGGRMESYRQEKTPVPAGGYSNFGNDGGYGGQSGFGQSRYDSGPPRRAGGYGGMVDDDNDQSRDQLFGAAPKRHQQQEQRPPTYGGGDGSGSTYGGGDQGGYGAYSERRELTAEEQEEEDANAAKQEIKFIKQQDVSSTRNALRLAQQAEETGRATLQRLGEQGERIHNTEKNLDLASSQNRIAEEKARELKTLNRSMFAVHVANPFTSKARQATRDQQILDNHQRERDERDATRSAAWASSARHQELQKSIDRPGKPGSGYKSSLADRAKYQFEADSDDERMEDEIDSNLDALHGAAGRLKNLSLAMGREVDEQNTHIERIIGKTDKVDDQIAMNRARLDRIK